MEFSETPAMIAAGENAGMYATGEGDYKGVIRRQYDTGKWSPKGIVIAPDGTSTGIRPRLGDEKAIIYRKFGSKTPSFSVAEDGLTFLAK